MVSDFGILGSVLYYGLLAILLLGFLATLTMLVLVVVGVCLDLCNIRQGQPLPRRSLD